ncbi:MAG: metal-dependent hydrolase [Phycisphaeraceae bacterium]
MPSPIAHSALVLLARPAAGRDRLDRLPRSRRWGLYALVFAALLAPDVDFLLGAIWPAELLDHGAAMHSLAVAGLFGGGFALAGRLVAGPRLSWPLLWTLGAAAYASHLIMDALTWGGGVMLLWPLSAERVASPVPLFYGARHSQPWAWRAHLTTLMTESLVWMVMLVGLWGWRRLSGRRPSRGMIARPGVRRERGCGL